MIKIIYFGGDDKDYGERAVAVNTNMIKVIKKRLDSIGSFEIEMSNGYTVSIPLYPTSSKITLKEFIDFLNSEYQVEFKI